MKSRWAGHVMRAAAAMSLVPGSLGAQGQWRIDLRVDNDLFVEFSPTRSSDHEYTHGTALTAESLDSWGPCGDGRRLLVDLSQRLFTPRDETPGAPGQRSDAGWLRLQAGCVSRTGPSRGSIRFTLGVVGPLSGGEQAQRAVHRLLHFREPRRWAEQLPNRADVAVGVGHRLLLTPPSAPVGLWLEGDIDAGTVRSSVRGAAAFSLRSGGHPDTGLALRVGASAVGNDYLLQGLATRRLLGWASLDGSLVMHRVVLSYGLTTRTRSYEEEPGGFIFGTIGVGFYW